MANMEELWAVNVEEQIYRDKKRNFPSSLMKWMRKLQEKTTRMEEEARLMESSSSEMSALPITSFTSAFSKATSFFEETTKTIKSTALEFAEKAQNEIDIETGLGNIGSHVSKLVETTANAGTDATNYITSKGGVATSFLSEKGGKASSFLTSKGAEASRILLEKSVGAGELLKATGENAGSFLKAQGSRIAETGAHVGSLVAEKGELVKDAASGAKTYVVDGAAGVKDFVIGEPENSCCCCPNLSYQERIVGLAFCIGFGFVISFFSCFYVIIPRKFAVLYTIGNLLGVGGTMFLVGPKRQMSVMCAPHRRNASMGFFAGMIVTLGLALTHQSFIFIIASVVVQTVALIWYILSYIPFGRAMAAKFYNNFGGACCSLMGHCCKFGCKGCCFCIQKCAGY